MKIDDRMIEKIAGLAYLEFGDEEKEEIRQDLEEILTFVEKLKELDTDDVEPLVYLSENTSGRSAVRLESRASENFIEVTFSNRAHFVSGTGVKRVFDPEFNASGDRVSMDLRLSLAYRYVAENGGELLVSSDQDEGTTFSVMLPLKREPTV